MFEAHEKYLYDKFSGFMALIATEVGAFASGGKSKPVPTDAFNPYRKHAKHNSVIRGQEASDILKQMFPNKKR